MKIPENIKNILKDAVKSLDKQIHKSYSKEQKFDNCIHCHKQNCCELCRAAIIKLIEARDKLYDQMNEITDFLRDNK